MGHERKNENEIKKKNYREWRATELSAATQWYCSKQREEITSTNETVDIKSRSREGIAIGGRIKTQPF